MFFDFNSKISCNALVFPGVQEKLGILNGGVVYAVFDYEAKHDDELSFRLNEEITVLRKGDEQEKEWWWSRVGDKEGYIPRNLLGVRLILSTRVSLLSTGKYLPPPF